jgi:N-acetylglucosamine-6-phosphate deacetylase
MNGNATQLHGNILTSDGWVTGSIGFSDMITEIKGRTNENPQEQTPASGDYILPGFIDLHVHGGGGKDIMEAGDAVHVVSRLHAQHGTTSMLATTMTAPAEELEAALGAIGRACRGRRAGSARLARSLILQLPRPWSKSTGCAASPP